MRDFDGVDASAIEHGGDVAHMVDAVHVADGVHAVAQGDVLNIELVGVDVELWHGNYLFNAPGVRRSVRPSPSPPRS